MTDNYRTTSNFIQDPKLQRIPIYFPSKDLKIRNKFKVFEKNDTFRNQDMEVVIVAPFEGLM